MAEPMELDQPETVATLETQQPTVQPAQPPQVDQDEAQSVDVQGKGKHVPLSALKEAREENKKLKERAAKADAYENWINQNKPKVDFMDQNQHLWQQPKPQAPPPDADPKLVRIAKSLDFYTTDGKPDL